MLQTLGFITHHPLTRHRPVSAVARYVGWQVGSQLKREHIHPWISGTKLVVQRGMHGATCHVYVGLQEYADMLFLLHLLRPGDVFVDGGANIGAYSVLASGVCRARSLAFEPAPETTAHLRRNVDINGLCDLVNIHQCALGAHEGEIGFTIGRDDCNRFDASETARKVAVRRLDEVAEARSAVMIKLDVEGYETEVLRGAQATLASPSVLAVLAETCNEEETTMLTSAGFERLWYDPKARTLSRTQEPHHWRYGNALFVRNEAAVTARITSAPQRLILGQHL